MQTATTERAARPAAVRTTLARAGAVWRLEQVQTIERPVAQVFAFFERPENLEAITPRWLRFRIVTPSPVPMHPEARIDYRLALFCVPLSWRTRIVRHEPGRGFVDEQERGPFALWRHEHEFRMDERGTRMTDRVEFRAPLGIFGRIAERLFVVRLVARIFEHRRARIVDLLERDRGGAAGGDPEGAARTGARRS